MSLLLTGFGPFGSFLSNPTGDAIEQLKASGDVATHVFPTSYEAVEAQLPDVLGRRKFDVAVAFGLLSSADMVRVEFIAHNESGGAKDVYGEVRSGVIVATGPSELLTTLPLQRVEDVLDQFDVHHEESTDAGGYVCNFLFYMLQYLSPHYGIQHSGFIHVPHPEVYYEAHGSHLDLVRLMVGLRLALASGETTP